MIQLKPYTNAHYKALMDYELPEEQSQFTTTFDYCINTRKDLADPLKQLVTIVERETPVGFFILDRGEAKLNITDNPAAILVRSLSLNPAHQGKGIGKQAMMLIPSFLAEYFPKIHKIMLTVNFKNLGAYQVYLKAGYTDTKRVINGPIGPQHLMSLSIMR